MLKHFFCTKCGAPIEADDSRATIFCMRCGSCESVPGSTAPNPAQTALNRPAGAGETPNLIIDYSAINPRVMLQIRITDTNQLYRLQSGMHIPLLMSVGSHILTLTIGNRSYRRAVSIYPTCSRPVIIHCAWDGRARINIDLPYANMGVPQGYYAQQPYAQPYPQAPVNIYVQQPAGQQIPQRPVPQFRPQPVPQIPQQQTIPVEPAAQEQTQPVEPVVTTPQEQPIPVEPIPETAEQGIPSEPVENTTE